MRRLPLLGTDMSTTAVMPVLSEVSLEDILQTKGHTSALFNNRRVISNASYMSENSFNSEATEAT